MIFNIVIWLAIVWLIFRYYNLPKKDDMNIVKVPTTYLIEAPNKTEVQKNVECAAFSSAYVLRHFGIESE